MNQQDSGEPGAVEAATIPTQKPLHEWLDEIEHRPLSGTNWAELVDILTRDKAALVKALRRAEELFCASGPSDAWFDRFHEEIPNILSEPSRRAADSEQKGN